MACWKIHHYKLLSYENLHVVGDFPRSHVWWPEGGGKTMAALILHPPFDSRSMVNCFGALGGLLCQRGVGLRFLGMAGTAIAADANGHWVRWFRSQSVKWPDHSYHHWDQCIALAMKPSILVVAEVNSFRAMLGPPCAICSAFGTLAARQRLGPPPTGTKQRQREISRKRGG